MNSIKTLIGSILGFLRSVLSEADGTGSASRVLMTIVVCGSVACLIYVTVRNGAIPELGSLTTYTSAVVGILYGINKGRDLVGDYFGKKQN